MKCNYRIHTGAVSRNLIPARVTPAQANIIYASEADVLNVALFGMTARQWRDAHPDLKGNIRDYATISELICLSNLESLNAVFIDQESRNANASSGSTKSPSSRCRYWGTTAGGNC